jgi:hypothetical protein
LNNGLSYVASLRLGEKQVEAKRLVYDTGSGLITVSGADCASCDNKIYDHKSSSTAIVVDQAFNLTVSEPS